MTTKNFELQIYFDSGVAHGVNRERRRIIRALIASLKARGGHPDWETQEIEWIKSATRAPRSKRK